MLCVDRQRGVLTKPALTSVSCFIQYNSSVLSPSACARQICSMMCTRVADSVYHMLVVCDRVGVTEAELLASMLGATTLPALTLLPGV